MEWKGSLEGGKMGDRNFRKHVGNFSHYSGKQLLDHSWCRLVGKVEGRIPMKGQENEH